MEPSTGSVVRASGLTGVEHDAPVGDRTDAHLGSTEILEHGDGGIHPFSERANPGEDMPVLGMVAVSEVEPGHVHPGFDERLEIDLARGGGADGTHDLRPSLHAGVPFRLG